MTTSSTIPNGGTVIGEPQHNDLDICKERLTNQQLAQQDAVNDAIYELLLELAGGEEREDDLWEIVGSVRDTISEEFHNRAIMAEKDFYPWVGCDCERGQVRQ